MRKYVVYLIITSLISLPYCQITEAKTVEWQDNVFIQEETTISQDNQVKVKPGTVIKLANSKSRLNIMGSLSIQGSEQNPAMIVIPNLLSKTKPTLIKDASLLTLNGNLKELEVHPYNVETKEIVDELKAFRYQYAFVWTVLMGICFYLVLNRTEYW